MTKYTATEPIEGVLPAGREFEVVLEAEDGAVVCAYWTEDAAVVDGELTKAARPVHFTLPYGVPASAVPADSEDRG